MEDKEDFVETSKVNGVQVAVGIFVKFQQVDVISPEGKILVKG